MNENDDDDDEDVRKLKLQKNQTHTTKARSLNTSDDDDDEKLISTKTENTFLTNRHQTNFDTLSDSSSSTTADDETSHITDLYANVGNKIDGKQRIKIKGDEIKIKGYSNRQRSKLINTDVFQLDRNTKKSLGEPDLSGFDFLNDYDEQS
ncbi:hypothetical protein I4U23_013455 [Adineta vaga]|nr:hypothetical protein I4U23_013455 [Adineta vaga]